MSRPVKCRMICQFPQTLEFIPAGNIENIENDRSDSEAIILTVDEYETIRLIDKEGLSQEQCCRRMQVARTTVQKIYDSARKKLADVLVDGRLLKIEGGEYRLCNGQNRSCGIDECYKLKLNQMYQRRKYKMKYVCDVCGYEYDEALGDPDNGIAPGTKWEDLPDDWVCPLCQVGKDQFSAE